MTALAAALTPIMIPVLNHTTSGINVLGMTMLLGYTITHGFILPINASPNIICMSTGAFTGRQFTKTGIVITVVGYLLMLLMAATCWRWLGWV